MSGLPPTVSLPAVCAGHFCRTEAPGSRSPTAARGVWASMHPSENLFLKRGKQKSLLLRGAYPHPGVAGLPLGSALSEVTMRPPALPAGVVVGGGVAGEMGDPGPSAAAAKPCAPSQNPSQTPGPVSLVGKWDTRSLSRSNVTRPDSCAGPGEKCLSTGPWSLVQGLCAASGSLARGREGGFRELLRVPAAHGGRPARWRPGAGAPSEKPDIVRDPLGSGGGGSRRSTRGFQFGPQAMVTVDPARQGCDPGQTVGHPLWGGAPWPGGHGEAQARAGRAHGGHGLGRQAGRPRKWR